MCHHEHSGVKYITDLKEIIYSVKRAHKAELVSLLYLPCVCCFSSLPSHTFACSIQVQTHTGVLKQAHVN